MFRIPQGDHSHEDGDHSDTGAFGDMVTPLRARDQGQMPVRTMGEVVDLGGRHYNTKRQVDELESLLKPNLL